MPNVSVNITSSEMRKFAAQIKSATDAQRRKVQEAIEETTLAVHRKAVQKAPVKRGYLRRSIHPAVAGNKLSGRVTAGDEKVDYALYVEKGRKAISGPLMVFKIGGKTIFTHKVAAAKPQPFMEPAADSERGPFIRRLENAFK